MRGNQGIPREGAEAPPAQAGDRPAQDTASSSAAKNLKIKTLKTLKSQLRGTK